VGPIVIHIDVQAYDKRLRLCTPAQVVIVCADLTHSGCRAGCPATWSRSNPTGTGRVRCHPFLDGIDHLIRDFSHLYCS